MKANWKFKKVFDYFDNRNVNSIWELSQKFFKMSKTDQAQGKLDIETSIINHLMQINTEAAFSPNYRNIQTTASIIFDDIYRSANLLYYYNKNVPNFLMLTARVVTGWLKQNKIIVHYLSNNTFTDKQRPFKLFREVFEAAGFRYFCPQELAYLQMVKEGYKLDDYDILIVNYISQARKITRDLIDKTILAEDSYLLLDIDGPSEAFEKDFSYSKKPGHVICFRSEAPQNSSKVMIIPSEKRK